MTLFYIDVSHYDWQRHNGNLDWPAIKAQGIDLVFIRATYGDPNGYNPQTLYFKEMAQAAKAAGLKVGGYHNLIRGDSASIKRQVTYFREQLALVGADYAMLDIEPYQSLIDNNLWPRLVDAEAFATEFNMQDPWRKLSVYLAQWVWSGYLSSADLRPLLGKAQGPLINANYRSYSDTGPGWNAFGNVTPEIWQFTDKANVPGASTTTDMNAFKGSFTELDTRLRKETALAVLTKNMVSLRNAFNEAFPVRDKESDGWIGDYAHSQGISGHNPDDTSQNNAEWNNDSDTLQEVRAIDIDTDFGNPTVSPQMVVDFIRSLPGVSSVLWYIIYNEKIYTAPDFEPVAYDGPSPHTEHIHFSGARSQTADNNETFNWNLTQLVEDNMDADQYFASVARAIRGDSTATGADRVRRQEFATAVRFALGYNWNQQDGDGENDQETVLLKLNRVLGQTAPAAAKK